MKRGASDAVAETGARTRRCLIVSPHFPPSTVAGVHRARHLAKHLPAHGWRPTVICIDPRYHVERLDPALADLVPLEVDIVRAGAIPAEYTRLVGVAGDIGLRGYLHLRSAIKQQIANAPAEAILITGSPYYPMLMAGWIRRHWRIPVVLDFQDPWVSHTWKPVAGWSKAALSQRLAVAFEPHAVRSADFITSVSDRQNDELAARYPWLDATRMAGIPIGGDPEDYEALRGRKGPTPTFPLRTEAINFCYAGTIWPPVLATLRAVLRAYKLLRERAPSLASKIVLNFLGTSANSLDTKGYRVLPIAQEIGITDNVREVPERRPFLEALDLNARADVALLIGSHEQHYTASKVFPVLMVGRPFLSIFHRLSSAHDILTGAGGGLALAFDNEADLDALVPTIASGLERLATDPAAFGLINPKAYAPYTAHAVAGRFAEVFDAVAR